MKAYVSGPMRGYPACNFPAFDQVRDWLESINVHAFSPADNDRAVWPEVERARGFAEGRVDDERAPANFSLRSLFAWDVWAVSQSDWIVLLPGHEESVGAAIELALARAFGLSIYSASFDAVGRCVGICREAA